MRPDITAGKLFPDYELSDHTGVVRSLSEIQGTLPMVLHLARGGYDPKEHRFLRHLADHYPDFKLAYTRICVIAKDNQLDINEFRDAVGAESFARLEAVKAAIAAPRGLALIDERTYGDTRIAILRREDPGAHG